MSPIKIGCIYWPPKCKRTPTDELNDRRDLHPSWAAGIEALEDYHHWVNAIVLPIAFQWIEEHKADVYANVPQELRDDIGVAIAAAFNLVQQMPLYNQGRTKADAIETAGTDSQASLSSANPVWSDITRKLRQNRDQAFGEHSTHLGETIP